MSKIPTHLTHKPIIGVKDYDKIDDPEGFGTDVRALSIGYSQWDKKYISAKIFRYTSQWSRQSEELPLHRVFDLSILIMSAFYQKHTNKFQNGYFDVSILDTNGMRDLNNFLEQHSELLEEKMIELSFLIKHYLKQKRQGQNLKK